MKEKILKLRIEGKTYNEIHKILGCSKSTISYYCSPNGKENNRIRTNKERELLRNELKILHGGKCSICGYNKSFHSLTFHHKDPTIKKDKVSSLVNSKGKKSAFEEAKKCILVCSNCHGEIHDGMIFVK